MNTAVIFLITVFILLFTRWYIKLRRYIKLLERFPSPPGVPLIGNTLDFLSTIQFIPNLAKYTKQYGHIIKLYFGPIPSKLFVSDYKFVEYILSSNTLLEKGAEYTFFSIWLGKGLLTSNGDSRWKSHRKLLVPSFHVQIFKEFLEVFESNTHLLVKKLEKELGKRSFDVMPYITLCSLDIICESALGTSIHAQEDGESDYVRSVKCMCQMLMYKAFNPLLWNNFLYRFTKSYSKEKQALKVLHDHTNSVIENRKKMFYDKLLKQGTIGEVGSKKRLALLDLLLQKSDEVATLTDATIREEVDTFMFAGHDTISSAMSFILLCLAENLDAQNKVVEELSQIFADDELRPIALQDINKMKYLDAVIKEVLRLYPPVPYFSRTVNEEFEYDGGIIPKGLTIVINVSQLHRNPEYFPEPDVFKPERFLNETGSRPLYSYIPFSEGPRNCIGKKFAVLEMKTVLRVLLTNYKFLPVNPRHEPILSAEAVLSSTSGICVRIVNRK